MNDDPFLMPDSAEAGVPFEALDHRFEWIRALRGCPQDPIFHAEGDVWIHTKMVLEALVASPAWQARTYEDRYELYTAALLHDVAKPRCTQIEGDRVRSLGHSPAGARQARRILWELGFSFAMRERIAALVRFHQVPYRGIEGTGLTARLVRLSQTCRIGDLACLSDADIRGRICPDRATLLEHVELFAMAAADLGCRDRAFAFATDHARASYFRHDHRDPHYVAHDDTRCTATIMSGLPGSGKTHYVEGQLGGVPCVRLDDIRRALGVPPERPQGPVIAEAYAQARALLRRGSDLVFDATNVSRELRRRLTGLCSEYGARTRIVYVETDPTTLRRQNQARATRVPDAVIDRLLGRWDPPDPTEAHEIVYVVDGERVPGPMDAQDGS